jgi:hydrogenase maturation protease
MKFGAADNFAEGRPAVLLIGYGNLLRSDDGVGPAIVSRLAAGFAGEGRCAFLTPHQLTPELAAEAAGAERVVFVDASVECAAGEVRVRRLDVAHAGGMPTRASAPLGHSSSPEAILGICKALYDRAPRAWSIGVGVANLTVGDRLSPAVSRAANRLCRRLAYRIRRWCGNSEQFLTHKDGTHVCQ